MKESIDFRLRGMTLDDLPRVAEMQRENTRMAATENGTKHEGYIGWTPTIEEMEDRACLECSVVVEAIRDGVNKVVGYVLTTPAKEGAADRHISVESLQDVELKIVTAISKISEGVVSDVNKVLGEETVDLKIGQVCVDSEFRGHGLGRKLYEYQQNELQQGGNVYELLTVRGSNQASLDFHKRMGLEVFRVEDVDDGEDKRYFFALRFPRRRESLVEDVSGDDGSKLRKAESLAA